ncbi:hypothetical protein L195_g028534 [Trifolium pratense]|uniref:Uncharacterized protein n=1 Tax=Trifolium pratense TaxID=57577 RepID=A0A2K3L290_TRIPR|nr:hypothetical protein L195_g028534 [Trifolium pratense]
MRVFVLWTCKIDSTSLSAAAVTFFPSDETRVPSKGASSSIFLLLLASYAISLLMIVVS